ncbi:MULTISPECIES: aa3-type cytochrome c oxidase subunit IV [Croceicoccus]|nr:MULTISPECIES: aa3-type cytochrome c oxidase subunit IV [Croceicoccus]MBS7668453.1 aa3-type cytochrome c oxidase subunit IV [Croceicoccus gelatinilyticus]
MATKDNMKAARSTYEGFISMTKWGTIACAIIAAIVVMIIA